MDKIILAAASCEEQKYFFDDKFSNIPYEIQKDIKIICVLMAQKMNATFLIGFDCDNEIYFDFANYEDDVAFDYIGSQLEIKLLMQQERKLIESLNLWYQINYTDDGNELLKKILKDEG